MKTPRAILHIKHDLHGGIWRHILDLSGWLALEGIQSFYAVPLPGEQLFKIRPVLTAQAETHGFRLRNGDREGAASVFSRLGIDHVHIHSLIGYGDWLEEIIPLAKFLGIEYDITIHDYATICPRVHMVDKGMIYCNSLSEGYCNECLTAGSSRFNGIDIVEWRKIHQAILRGSRRIFVPSEDVRSRMQKYLNIDLEFSVKAHPEARFEGACARQPLSNLNGTRTIAIIGTLVNHKGSLVVHDLAADATARALPLRFLVFGETNLKHLSEFPNTVTAGAFAEEEIDELLIDNRPNIALFPSVCPETYSYALSIAFRNRIFPICFDIGAQAQRIRDARYGLVVSLEFVFCPRELNDLLLSAQIWDPPDDLVKRASWAGRWLGAREYYEF